MSGIFSVLLVFAFSIGTFQVDENEHAKLVDSIAWSIGHEGCAVYQINPETGRRDAILPAEKLRQCFLDSQKDSRETLKLIQDTPDPILLQVTSEAVQVVKIRYSVKENFGWVLFHEGQLPYFASLAKSGDFAAIRARYKQLQEHNPNAVNALSGVTDSELAAALDQERISVLLSPRGADTPDLSTLMKIASYTEPTITTLRSDITLSDLANQVYGTSAKAYLAALTASNPSLLTSDLGGSQTLSDGATVIIPSLPVPDRAESLPLRNGLLATTVAAVLSTSNLPTVKSEVPKKGQIEKPAKAKLQSTTVKNIASDGEQWYLLSISADKVKKSDLAFYSPPVMSVVGIVDGGVDKDHPLIKPVLWTLPAELASLDWPGGSIGYDFYQENSNPIEELDDSHGTHVTGLVTGRQLATWLPVLDDAGLSNNVGAFALKVAGNDGTFDFTFAQNAIEAGIDKGIHLFNLSLTGPKSNLLNIELSRPEHINTTLFVLAAGNDAINLDSDKAQLQTFRKADGTGLENFIFVAALADTGKLADFSNYGKQLVQIAAPGVEISSTIHPDGFGSLSGTSQAAPLVTLTAAIIKAEIPQMVPLAVKHRILNTCEWDENLKEVVENGCRLNFAKAIICGSDLLELRKNGTLVRGTIERKQFFSETAVDNSLVRVWIQSSRSAIYAYASGKREQKSLTAIKKISLKLSEGEKCPNLVHSGTCTISASEVKDIVFRLR